MPTHEFINTTSNNQPPYITWQTSSGGFLRQFSSSVRGRDRMHMLGWFPMIFFIQKIKPGLTASFTPFSARKKTSKIRREPKKAKSLEWSSAPCCQLTVATLLLVIFAWKWINMSFFSRPPQSATCPPSRQNLLLPAQGSHRRGTRRPNWTLQLLFAPTEIHRHLECMDIMIWVNWSHEIEKKHILVYMFLKISGFTCHGRAPMILKTPIVQYPPFLGSR